MKSRRLISVIQTVFGIILLVLAVLAFGSDEDMTLPIASAFGLGTALVAMGIGGFIFTLSLSPSINITEEKEDPNSAEARALRVREKSGYMTNRIMRFVMLALVIILFILQESFTIILLSIGVMAIGYTLYAVFILYYKKRVANFQNEEERKTTKISDSLTKGDNLNIEREELKGIEDNERKFNSFL